ncbi:glycine/D-amino acid oxidase-like deaminating enzyme [Sphingopyxis panaciterrae]|uniref:NAD(P)/FAD-dependent oxidoreductase n=1 Tax=Sphingopyxis panaciterrae TaxID=363841 RepID=UPI00142418E4|nr:FAD-binding oxidoreductase [Sphingopyxis panaciterrae]NIJ38174.1 glycine/D-amino acid oxidase-like deaminating enzyme [Sphingopyxis panaciterrae]
MTLGRRKLLAALATVPAALALGGARKEPKPKDPPEPRKSRKRKGAKAPQSHVDVAVVGAGALGAWTAWHLVRQGKSVRLFDAYGAGNGRAASNLPSMMLDPVQGGDALYASLVSDSYAAWQRLSDTASLPILTACQALTTLTATDSIAAARDVDRESGDKLKNRFTQIAWHPGEAALVAEKAAMLAGRRGVLETLLDGQIEPEAVVMPAPLRDKRSDLYVLPDGGTAGSIVYACGAWLTELFPQLLTPQRLSAVRHNVFHFGPGQGDLQYRPPAMPAFVDRAYGFTLLPDIEGEGVRCWRSAGDASVDPDSFDRRADERALTDVRLWLAGRLPRIGTAPIVASAAVHDCRTVTGDLLLDRLPEHPRAWVVGGAAGRAFSLAPAIGARVAAHVADASRPLEPRWALARLTGGAV